MLHRNWDAAVTQTKTNRLCSDSGMRFFFLKIRYPKWGEKRPSNAFIISFSRKIYRDKDLQIPSPEILFSSSMPIDIKAVSSSTWLLGAGRDLRLGLSSHGSRDIEGYRPTIRVSQ